MEENVTVLKKALQIDKVEEVSLIEGLIHKYVKNNGELFSFCKLSDYLSSNNISSAEIQQIILLLQVEGAKQLFNQINASQNEINKFIENAKKQSGLRTELIIKLTALLLQATGISEKIEISSDLSKIYEINETGFSVPYSVYCIELLRIKQFIQKGEYKNALKHTTALLPTGIAEAKYLHAECLKVCSEQVDTEFVLGLQKEAADDGYSLAALAVADYYYSIQDYSLAYRYYMGYGAPLLSVEQRSKVTEIENLRLYNQKMLKNSYWIEALIILTVVLSFFGTIYSSYWFLGFMVILSTANVLYFRKKYLNNVNPFDVNNTYILYLVLPWVLYMVIRICF